MIRLSVMIGFLALAIGCKQNPATEHPPAPPPTLVVELLPDAFEANLKSTLNRTILDLRPATDFQRGHFYKSLNMPCAGAQCLDALQGLGRDNTYYLYCANGHDSGVLAVAMEKAGFTKIFVLKGGINAWVSAGKMLYQI